MRLYILHIYILTKYLYRIEIEIVISSHHYVYVYLTILRQHCDMATELCNMCERLYTFEYFDTVISGNIAAC